ncbi:MAG: hypothetical protein ACE5J3_00180 [Methanosarcinales archaeon]
MAEKINKTFNFYDIIGIILIIVSLFFFIRVLDFLNQPDYIAAIVGALIGASIFSAGINIIKFAAASKAYSENCEQ